MELKIKSYQERMTYLTCHVPDHLTKDQVIKLGNDLKQIIDKVTFPTTSSPNIIRFEDVSGIYNYQLIKIKSYGN